MSINDPINPSHYKSGGTICCCGHVIECIEISRWHNFNIGNVIKYLWRAKHKESYVEQLKKAHWYLRDEIRKYEPDFEVIT